MTTLSEQDLDDLIIRLHVQAFLTSLSERSLPLEGVSRWDVDRYLGEVREIFHRSGLDPYAFSVLVGDVIGEHEGELREALQSGTLLHGQAWKRYLSLLQHKVEQWQDQEANLGRGGHNDQSDDLPF